MKRNLGRSSNKKKKKKSAAPNSPHGEKTNTSSMGPQPELGTYKAVYERGWKGEEQISDLRRKKINTAGVTRSS